MTVEVTNILIGLVVVAGAGLCCWRFVWGRGGAVLAVLVAVVVVAGGSVLHVA